MPRFRVPGKGEITISEDKVEVFLKDFPDAEPIDVTTDPPSNRFSVEGKGEITIEPDRLETFMKDFPNAKRIETTNQPKFRTLEDFDLDLKRIAAETEGEEFEHLLSEVQKRRDDITKEGDGPNPLQNFGRQLAIGGGNFLKIVPAVVEAVAAKFNKDPDLGMFELGELDRTNRLIEAGIPSNVKQNVGARKLNTTIDGEEVEVVVESDGKFREARDLDGFKKEVSPEGIKKFNDSKEGENTKLNLVADDLNDARSFLNNSAQTMIDAVQMLTGSGVIRKGVQKGLVKKGVSKELQKKALRRTTAATAGSIAFVQSFDDNFIQAQKDLKGDKSAAANLAFTKSAITGTITAAFPAVETGFLGSKAGTNAILQLGQGNAKPFASLLAKEVVEEDVDLVANNLVDVGFGVKDLSQVVTAEEQLNNLYTTLLVSSPGSYIASKQASRPNDVTMESIHGIANDPQNYAEFSNALSESKQDKSLKDFKQRTVDEVKTILDTQDVSQEKGVEIATAVFNRNAEKQRLETGDIPQSTRTKIEEKIQGYNSQIESILGNDNTKNADTTDTDPNKEQNQEQDEVDVEPQKTIQEQIDKKKNQRNILNTDVEADTTDRVSKIDEEIKVLVEKQKKQEAEEAARGERQEGVRLLDDQIKDLEEKQALLDEGDRELLSPRINALKEQRTTLIDQLTPTQDQVVPDNTPKAVPDTPTATNTTETVDNTTQTEKVAETTPEVVETVETQNSAESTPLNFDKLEEATDLQLEQRVADLKVDTEADPGFDEQPIHAGLIKVGDKYFKAKKDGTPGKQQIKNKDKTNAYDTFDRERRRDLSRLRALESEIGRRSQQTPVTESTGNNLQETSPLTNDQGQVISKRDTGEIEIDGKILPERISEVTPSGDQRTLAQFEQDITQEFTNAEELFNTQSGTNTTTTPNNVPNEVQNDAVKSQNDATNLAESGNTVISQTTDTQTQTPETATNPAISDNNNESLSSETDAVNFPIEPDKSQRDFLVAEYNKRNKKEPAKTYNNKVKKFAAEQLSQQKEGTGKRNKKFESFLSEVNSGNNPIIQSRKPNPVKTRRVGTNSKANKKKNVGSKSKTNAKKDTTIKTSAEVDVNAIVDDINKNTPKEILDIVSSSKKDGDIKKAISKLAGICTRKNKKK